MAVSLQGCNLRKFREPAYNNSHGQRGKSKSLGAWLSVFENMLTCEQVRFYGLFNGYYDLQNPNVSISQANHLSIYGFLCDDTGVDAQKKWASELKS
jgi:hypothetical protein